MYVTLYAIEVLTGMRSLVGLQVGALCVDLLAANKLTFVYASLGVGTVIVFAMMVFCGGACKREFVLKGKVLYSVYELEQHLETKY